MIETAAFIYYFNILAIAGIVYFLLAIAYQRSKQVIINTAEQPFKRDNSMLKLIIRIAVVAMVFFAVREYGLTEHVEAAWEQIHSFFSWTSDKISEVVNG